MIDEPIGVRGFRMSRPEAAGWLRAALAEYPHDGERPGVPDVMTAPEGELLSASRRLQYSGGMWELTVAALLLATARDVKSEGSER